MFGVTTANSPPGVILSSVAAAHAPAKTKEARIIRILESCILLVGYTDRGVRHAFTDLYKVKVDSKAQERIIISGGEA